MEVQLEESNLLEFILSPANLNATYIYAFVEDGSCSGSQKMKNNAQDRNEIVPSPIYHSYHSRTGEEYVIPENPRLDDVIVMRAGKQKCTCHDDGDCSIKFIFSLLMRVHDRREINPAAPLGELHIFQ